MAKQKEQLETDVAPRLGRSSTNKLSLPLNDDGTIDWSGVRDSTKEKFTNAVINDSIALEAIGLAAGGDEGETPTEALPEELQLTDAKVGMLLDGVNKIFGFGFGWGAKTFMRNPFRVDKNGRPAPMEIEPPILMAAFKLSEKDHEELDPMTKKELEKYTGNVPDWVKNNFNLIMLVSMFGKISFENGMKAVRMQLELDQTRIARARQDIKHPPNRPPDSDKPPQQAEAPSNGQASMDPTINGIPTFDLETPPEPPPPRV